MVRAGVSPRRSTSSRTTYNGRVVVAKMNVDENPATPMRFSIRGIPTLLLFKGGQLVEQVVGLADKTELKSSSTSTSEPAVFQTCHRETSSSSAPARPV